MRAFYNDLFVSEFKIAVGALERMTDFRKNAGNGTSPPLLANPEMTVASSNKSSISKSLVLPSPSASTVMRKV
jgi:hypothetical protein